MWAPISPPPARNVSSDGSTEGVCINHQVYPKLIWNRSRQEMSRALCDDSIVWQNANILATHPRMIDRRRLITSAVRRTLCSHSGADDDVLTGNMALGGDQAVAAWSDYVFSPDGSVRRDGGGREFKRPGGLGDDVRHGRAGAAAAVSTGWYWRSTTTTARRSAA
jgi:hypothetical protein